MNAVLGQRGHAPAEPGVPVSPATDLFVGLTAGLAEGRELEALLGQFLGPVVRLAGAQAGLVRTLSDDGAHMRLVGSMGLPEDVRQAEQSVDRHCGTCGVAADSDDMTWAPDLRRCAQHSKGGYFADHCKRMLAVPLRHRERVLGLYNLFFDTEQELAPDVLGALRSIGELLGLALHNARLEREHLFATVMAERKFLASELHDSIAQTLVYVNMRLPLLQDAMLQHNDNLAQKYLGDVKQAVGSIQSNLREILTNFRVVMDPHGLFHALRGLVDEFSRRSSVVLVFETDVCDLGLSVEQEVQVFHIVQEALANVSRHSRARHAWLRLRCPENNLEVVVEDDGSGLDAVDDSLVASEPHFGLSIMRERAQALGGVLVWQDRPGGGTRVCLRLPLGVQLEGSKDK